MAFFVHPVDSITIPPPVHVDNLIHKVDPEEDEAAGVEGFDRGGRGGGRQ